MNVDSLFNLDKSSSYTEASSVLFGLECELEGVSSYGKINPEYIVAVDDGSLRNSGKEFLTKPNDRVQTIELFKHIHASVSCLNGIKFSPRTSVHVHVNCLNLDTDIVRSIIHRYALLEPLFFMMVESDRMHNIHCVPLAETFLSKVYYQDLKGMVRSWHKYTALNIKPLSDIGTIEFRHMHGHDNPVLLQDWLTVIERLFEYSKKHGPITADQLQDDKVYQLFDTVFIGTQVAQVRPSVPTLLSNSVIDLKKLFI